MSHEGGSDYDNSFHINMSHEGDSDYDSSFKINMSHEGGSDYDNSFQIKMSHEGDSDYDYSFQINMSHVLTMPKKKVAHRFDMPWLARKRQNYKKIHEHFKELQKIYRLSHVRKF